MIDTDMRILAKEAIPARARCCELAVIKAQPLTVLGIVRFTCKHVLTSTARLQVVMAAVCRQLRVAVSALDTAAAP